LERQKRPVCKGGRGLCLAIREAYVERQKRRMTRKERQKRRIWKGDRGVYEETKEAYMERQKRRIERDTGGV